MKNRISAPVDVLNALASPMTCVVTPGALGSLSTTVVTGGTSKGMGGATRWITFSFQAKG